MTELKKQISASLRKDLEAGELILPSLPEVAMKIQEEVKKKSSTAHSIAKVIMLDPGLTAHFLKVANSPLYRTQNSVQGLPEAIGLIGINSVLNMALTYTMRTMFVNTEGPWKKVLIHQWNEATELAAIVAVLADYLPNFNSDHMMVAAMLQNIGALPLINHLQHFPGLEQEEVETLVEENATKAGLALVKLWGLGKSFEDVIKARHDWMYESTPELDTTDLITIARYHYMKDKQRLEDCPPTSEIAAFRHLEELDFTAEMSMQWIDSAREKIRAIKRMLCM
ncbi:HDOD domain-containing protein [Litoribrevibacter euphylliae]|uniref:HDOD domain-containing protein n=1 Tax=Litoribrevibacter euphylliae TaxID=1834034 RepID=A0ABV7HJW8_9GAMM